MTQRQHNWTPFKPPGHAVADCVEFCTRCGWERWTLVDGIEYRRGDERVAREPECSGLQRAGTG